MRVPTFCLPALLLVWFAKEILASELGIISSQTAARRDLIYSGAVTVSFEQHFEFVENDESGSILTSVTTISWSLDEGHNISVIEKSIAEKGINFEASQLKVKNEEGQNISYEINIQSDFIYIRIPLDQFNASITELTTVIEYQMIDEICFVDGYDSFEFTWPNHWNIPVSEVTYKITLSRDRIGENQNDVLFSPRTSLNKGYIDNGTTRTFFINYDPTDLELGENPESFQFLWKPYGNIVATGYCYHDESGIRILRTGLIASGIIPLLACLCLIGSGVYHRYFDDGSEEQANSIPRIVVDNSTGSQAIDDYTPGDVIVAPTRKLTAVKGRIEDDADSQITSFSIHTDGIQHSDSRDDPLIQTRLNVAEIVSVPSKGSTGSIPGPYASDTLSRLHGAEIVSVPSKGSTGSTPGPHSDDNLSKYTSKASKTHPIKDAKSWDELL